MSHEKQVNIWFPDIDVLRKIKKIAKKRNRGIGYIICERWRENEARAKLPDLQKKR